MKIADDEAPADAREQAEAARFARLVDDLVAGAPLPPAMAAEERVLLDTAALLRPLRRDDVLDAAFRATPPPRRGVPWLAAASLVLAVAALMLLLLRPTPRLPLTMRSRPADALVGPIDRARAGDARARADLVYADRLAGYRQIALGGRR